MLLVSSFLSSELVVMVPTFTLHTQISMTICPVKCKKKKKTKKKHFIKKNNSQTLIIFQTLDPEKDEIFAGFS